MMIIQLCVKVKGCSHSTCSAYITLFFNMRPYHVSGPPQPSPEPSVAVEMQVWQWEIKALQWSVELQDAHGEQAVAAESCGLQTVFRTGRANGTSSDR